MREEDLAEVVDALMATYGELDSTHRLPSKGTIVAVMRQIRRLLFPGYYVEEAPPPASLRYWVGTWVCQLQSDLSRTIYKALIHEEPGAPRHETRDRANALALEFVRGLPELRSLLRLDAEAALEGDPAAHDIDEIILTYPGFEAITVYRAAHLLYQEGVPYIPRAMAEHAHDVTGIDIHPGARIGKRFFIDHGTGVVIGETTDIGDRVKIYQGVTLGALSVERALAGSKRHPTLEDGVVIYAGATVLGGQTIIGEGAVIGGNVWLTSSVDPRVTVIESPPTLNIKAQRAKARGETSTGSA